MINSLSQRGMWIREQDLTGQPMGCPAYPSRNVANSSPPQCLLKGEGGSGSTHEEENIPCPIPVSAVLPSPEPGLELEPTPHLEADTRTLQSLCSLRLPAVGIDRGSSALQGYQVLPGLGPVPPAHVLETDMGRCRAQAPAQAWGTDAGGWKGRMTEEGVKKRDPLTNDGQELPDVSCQVPIHDLPVEYVLGQWLLQ